jgi:hypothetical protein
VYRAILAVGESNTGGQGLVSALPTSLTTATPRVQQLIVPNSRGYTNVGNFEPLHIGVNNNLDHSGLDPTYHSWEAGFLQHLDANPQTEPIYYVQTGQGGSTFVQWGAGGDGLTRAETRIAYALARFADLGIAVQWEIWLSLGINSFLGGISTGAYQAGMIQLVSDIRAMLGVGTAARVRSPMFMQTVRDAWPALVAVHEALPASISNMQIINTAGIPTDDIYHWSSLGQRQLCQPMAAPT